MGKAKRWLKGLFDMNRNHHHFQHHTTDPKTSSDSNDNQRRSFGHSGRSSGGLCQNPATIPPNITPAEAAWLRSFHTTSRDTSEEDQRKHAIAVAAATAAAADAAVIAAQAAAAVVCLTSYGGDAMLLSKKGAAVRIQSAFRGYLARKAHRALKGLVRLQALVKGFLVRKQADATFHCMQALLRAQATVKSRKARAIANHEARPRRSMERFEDTRFSVSLDSNSIDESPKIVEMDTGRPRSRSRRNININACFSDFGDDYPSSQALSPLPFQIPAPIAVPSFLKWGGDESRFLSTTPRFMNSSNASPSKMSSSSSPNYMAGTQSFKAKLRSFSAPKQRPKRKAPANEMEIQMQRSSSAVSVKNAVMGKIEREFGRGGNLR